MKQLKYLFTIILFSLAFIGCGKNDLIYDYTEIERYDLIKDAYINNEVYATEKLEQIEKTLQQDLRSEKKKIREGAKKELKILEAQTNILLRVDYEGELEAFTKAYQNNKTNEFLDDFFKRMEEEENK